MICTKKREKNNCLANRCVIYFFLEGGRSLHSLVLTLFSTKATPKLINKIAPNMSTNSKKEKEALGKN